MAWKLQSICFYNILILTAFGRPGGRSSINLNDASEYAKIEQLVTKANAELGPANGIADPSSYRPVLIDATKQVVAGYSYEINYFLHKSFCFELLVFAIISFHSLNGEFFYSHSLQVDKYFYSLFRMQPKLSNAKETLADATLGLRRENGWMKPTISISSVTRHQSCSRWYKNNWNGSSWIFHDYIFENKTLLNKHFITKTNWTIFCFVVIISCF